MTSITGPKKTMSPTDLMAFFVEEAQHRVINDEQSKAAESALLGHRKSNNSKTKRKTSNRKEQSDKFARSARGWAILKPNAWPKVVTKRVKG